MKNDLKIAAVVVTYNRKELLKECLQALLNQTRVLDEIIVIDNASTDGTEQMVLSEFPQVTYVRLPENIGGAGGFHEGMKLAYEKGHDWIWVMDDDAKAKEDSLEKLLSAIAELKEQGPIIGLWSQVVGEDVDTFSTKKTLKPLDSAMFVGFAVNSKLIEKVGFPRGDFFLYYDDVEYCSRIRHAGGIILMVPNSIIFHKDWTHQPQVKRQFMGWIIKTPQIPRWKFYYLSRNDILRGLTAKDKLKGVIRSFKLLGKVLFTQPRAAGFVVLGIFHGILGISGKKIDPSKVG
jgi:GT2 family glycosyltransferase